MTEIFDKAKEKIRQEENDVIKRKLSNDINRLLKNILKNMFFGNLKAVHDDFEELKFEMDLYLDI